MMLTIRELVDENPDGIDAVEVSCRIVGPKCGEDFLLVDSGISKPVLRCVVPVQIPGLEEALLAHGLSPGAGGNVDYAGHCRVVGRFVPATGDCSLCLQSIRWLQFRWTTGRKPKPAILVTHDIVQQFA